MITPYHILGVPLSADDQVIRQAYLKAIKESPPDAQPQRFKIVSGAYSQIKDQTSRHKHILFNHDCPAGSPLGALVHFGSHCQNVKPLSLNAMKELLTAVVRENGK